MINSKIKFKFLFFTYSRINQVLFLDNVENLAQIRKIPVDVTCDKDSLIRLKLRLYDPNGRFRHGFLLVYAIFIC